MYILLRPRILFELLSEERSRIFKLNSELALIYSEILKLITDIYDDSFFFCVIFHD